MEQMILTGTQMGAVSTAHFMIMNITKQVTGTSSQ
jgi:hypothetical protein